MNIKEEIIDLDESPTSEKDLQTIEQEMKSNKKQMPNLISLSSSSTKQPNHRTTLEMVKRVAAKVLIPGSRSQVVEDCNKTTMTATGSSNEARPKIKISCPRSVPVDCPGDENEVSSSSPSQSPALPSSQVPIGQFKVNRHIQKCCPVALVNFYLARLFCQLPEPHFNILILNILKKVAFKS